MNEVLIVLFPLLCGLCWIIFHEEFLLQRYVGWAVFAYLFGVAEHINYYYVQLMYDNLHDWKYLKINRKLKTASLKKDIKAQKGRTKNSLPVTAS